MKDETFVIVALGLGLFVSLAAITFLLTRTNNYVSFTRDSEGRIVEIMERSL